MTPKEIRAQIRETKREMKELGIRRISCMNGGLTSQENHYNTRLMVLNAQLDKAQKAECRDGSN